MSLPRETAIWLILIAATLTSWAVGYETAGGETAAIVVIAIAFAKAGLVGAEFMELRHAPRFARLLFGGWLIAVAGTLAVFFHLAGG